VRAGVRAAGNADADVADATDPKVLEAVRMVLSGVARTHARFPCGKNLIAQMLCGSHNAKVTKLRLDKLSTFGLLKHLTQPEVVSIIDALVVLQCLQQVELDRFRPVVELTDFGAEVMKGKASLSDSLPVPAELLRKLGSKRKGEGGRTKGEGGRGKGEDQGNPKSEIRNPKSEIALPPSESDSHDPELLDELRHWREEIADEAGVPVHYILGNETLAELARCRPQTHEQLMAIKGIGPVKAERYGTTLLEILCEGGERGERGEEREENGEDADIPDPSSLIPHPSSLISHPSHYWTQRLLQAGFTVDECAAIRGISQETVLEHAKAAQR
jgi:ATP-dependent DNA helicase RecQ